MATTGRRWNNYTDILKFHLGVHNDQMICQPVGSSLDTQPTAAVRRASILTHTNMGVFQSNYTDFVGIFMKEQWERLREHMPKIMIHGLFKDGFYFPPLLGLISTKMDWKHQPVEGLFINWWKCVTWGGGFLIPSDSDWVGLDRVLMISMERATLQPCYMLVAQWRCGHTKWDFWCWLLQSTMNHPGFAPD